MQDKYISEDKMLGAIKRSAKLDTHHRFLLKVLKKRDDQLAVLGYNYDKLRGHIRDLAEKVG